MANYGREVLTVHQKTFGSFLLQRQPLETNKYLITPLHCTVYILTKTNPFIGQLD